MRPLLRTRNLLLLLAVLLVAGLAAVVSLRYRPPAEVVQSGPALPAGVDLALQEFHYTHTDGGVARWRLSAKRAEHQAAAGALQLTGLEVTFFDPAGKEQFRLRARNGRITSDYSVIEVHDEVEIANAGGYRLLTDHLTFRQSDRSISTDAPVRVEGERLQLAGVGMHLDLATKRLRILAGVRARVQPRA